MPLLPSRPTIFYFYFPVSCVWAIGCTIYIGQVHIVHYRLHFLLYNFIGYIWIKSGYIPFFQLYSLLFHADVGNDDDYHDIIVMAIDCPSD